MLCKSSSIEWSRYDCYDCWKLFEYWKNYFYADLSKSTRPPLRILRPSTESVRSHVLWLPINPNFVALSNNNNRLLRSHQIWKSKIQISILTKSAQIKQSSKIWINFIKTTICSFCLNLSHTWLQHYFYIELLGMRPDVPHHLLFDFFQDINNIIGRRSQNWYKSFWEIGHWAATEKIIWVLDNR